MVIATLMSVLIHGCVIDSLTPPDARIQNGPLKGKTPPCGI
jgi:hypothetical protein